MHFEKKKIDLYLQVSNKSQDCPEYMYSKIMNTLQLIYNESFETRPSISLIYSVYTPKDHRCYIDTGTQLLSNHKPRSRTDHEGFDTYHGDIHDLLVAVLQALSLGLGLRCRLPSHHSLVLCCWFPRCHHLGLPSRHLFDFDC